MSRRIEVILRKMLILGTDITFIARNPICSMVSRFIKPMPLAFEFGEFGGIGGVTGTVGGTYKETWPREDEVVRKVTSAFCMR